MLLEKKQLKFPEALPPRYYANQVKRAELVRSYFLLLVTKAVLGQMLV